MNRPKTYKTSQMERVAEKLKLEKSDSSHHIRGFIISDSGKKLYPPIYFSKGKKDIGPAVVDSIRKALFLQNSEVDALFRCSMSREEYLKIRFSRTS